MEDLAQEIEALRRDPTSVEAANGVRKSARAAGALRVYAEAFAERGERLEARNLRREAISSLIEAALVYEEELEDLEAAAAAYRKVLDIEGDHRRALFALGLLYHDLGRWEELIALYRRRLEQSRDDGERTTLHLYVAELLSERRGDDSAAFDEIMTAARLAPKNLRIIGRLEKLGERTKRISEVAVVIGDLILHQEDPRVRAALSLRLAQLHLGPLQDSTRALAYLRAALADDGGNPEILSEIEDVFRERVRFDELAEVLEDAVRDRRVGPHRVRLERELARIYELELGDHRRALTALTRAARHLPEDRELLDEILRVGLLTGHMEPVAATFEEVAARTENNLLRTYLRLKLGHIYTTLLVRMPEAVRVYWSILTDDPTHREAQRRLKFIHERASDHAALARVLELEAQSVGGDEAIDAWVRLARLRRTPLDDLDGAAEAWRHVLELNPEHQEAQLALTEYELIERPGPGPTRTGETPLVAESFARPPSDAGPSSAGPALPRVVAAPKLVGPEPTLLIGPAPTLLIGPAPTLLIGPAPSPVPGPESSPVLAPESSPVLAPESSPVLAPESSPVRAPESSSEPGPESSPESGPESSPMGPAASRVMAVPSLGGSALSRVMAVPSPGGSARFPAEPPAMPSLAGTTLLVRAVPSTLVSLAPPPGMSSEDLVSPRPGAPARTPPPPPREEPITLVAPPPIAEEPATGAGRRDFDDADRDDAEAGPRPSDPAERSGVAELAERSGVAELADRSGFVEPAVARDPAEHAPLTREEVIELDAVERLVELRGELADAEASGDPDRSIEIREAIVRLHERLGQDEQAFPEQVRLAELDPTRERLEEMLRLGRRAKKAPELLSAVDRLEGQLALEARVALGLTLAEIEIEERRDLAAAAARLARLHALAPDDVAVFDRWTSVLDLSRRFSELAEVLTSQALALSGTGEGLALARRAARVRDVNLDDPRGAAQVLRAYLERAPERDELRSEVRALLEKAGAYAELVAFLEASLERLEGDERTQTRLSIARLYLDHLGHPAAAERTLRAGLEERALDPELLERLETLYAQRGAHSELVGVLFRRLEALTEARARNALRRRIATIAEEHLHDAELVSQVLGDAVREDATDVDAIYDLERARRARGDFDGVRKALVLLSQALDDRDERAKVLVEMAEIDAEVNGDLDAARDALDEAIQLVPSHQVALERLATVEERRGHDEAAIAALRRLAAEASKEARAAARVRLGRIYELRLGDREAAADEFVAACEADPRNLDALLGLFQIREAEERWAEALDLALRAAALLEDDRERADLFRRAGAIALDRVGDEQKALEAWEQVLRADPEDLATMASLGDLYFRKEDHARAWPHLEAAALGLSDPVRKQSLFRAAGFAAEALNRYEDAIRCYEGALELAPRAREPIERLASLIEKSGGDAARVHDLSALLLLHHEHTLSAGERSQVYLRMARMKQRLDDLPAVVRLARKAHQLGEGRPEPLLLLAEALEASGETLEAAESLRKLAQLGRASKEKRDALVRGAGLLAQRGGEVARAAAMLAEAQLLVPEDVEVARLLAAHQVTLGDPRGAILALLTPAKLLTGRGRADLLVRAAEIAVGPGRDRARAKSLLSEAVALVPTHAEALEALRVLLEFDGEHETLVALEDAAATAFLEDPATARDAHDLDRRAAARHLLSDALRSHRVKLKDPARALQVARRLGTLTPQDAQLQDEIADLLDHASARSANGDARALTREAIGAWSRIVEEQPGLIEAVRRLEALHVRAGDLALARATRELFIALGGDGTGEASPFPDPEGEAGPRAAIEVPIHPAERTELETLWSELGFAPVRAFYDALPEPKPKKRDLVAASALRSPVARALAQATEVLGGPAPALYARDDATLVVAPTWALDAPGLLISPALADKMSAVELRFVIGRALSLLRPRALALVLVPLEVLREGLVGLARPPGVAEATYADPRSAKKRGKALEKLLSVTDRYRLSEEVGRWLSTPDRSSLARERAGVLRTAERAGLVASGSLLGALATLTMLSGGQADRAWRIPLIEWASSRGYAEIVRRTSGVES